MCFAIFGLWVWFQINLLQKDFILLLRGHVIHTNRLLNKVVLRHRNCPTIQSMRKITLLFDPWRVSERNYKHSNFKKTWISLWRWRRTKITNIMKTLPGALLLPMRRGVTTPCNCSSQTREYVHNLMHCLLFPNINKE